MSRTPPPPKSGTDSNVIQFPSCIKVVDKDGRPIDEYGQLIEMPPGLEGTIDEVEQAKWATAAWITPADLRAPFDKSVPFSERSVRDKVLGLFKPNERRFIADLLEICAPWSGDEEHPIEVIRVGGVAAKHGLVSNHIKRTLQKMAWFGWYKPGPTRGTFWLSFGTRLPVIGYHAEIAAKSHRRGGGHAKSREVGRLGGRPRKGGSRERR